MHSTPIGMAAATAAASRQPPPPHRPREERSLLHAGFSTAPRPTRNTPSLTMKATTIAMLLGALLLLSAAHARESKWCAEQREKCEAGCPKGSKVDYECHDTDGAFNCEVLLTCLSLPPPLGCAAANL